MRQNNDFRQLSSVYRETTDAIMRIVGREISGRFDQADNPPEISTLSYKSVVNEIARSATNVLGDRNIRAILQEVARELQCKLLEKCEKGRARARNFYYFDP